MLTTRPTTTITSSEKLFVAILYFLNGYFPVSSFIFVSSTVNSKCIIYLKFCLWQDLNCRLFVSEAIALPEPRLKCPYFRKAFRLVKSS